MRAWTLTLILAISLVGGCLGADDDDAAGLDAAGTDNATTNAAEDPLLSDPWNGADRITLIEYDAGLGFQFDILCQAGGGIHLPRYEDSIVPTGTDHIAITIGVSGPHTGYQIGHVVTDDPAYDERGHDNITWTDPVRPTQETTFTVDVASGPFETLDGAWVHHFYAREVVTGEEDCYTGIGAGEHSVLIEAVKG